MNKRKRNAKTNSIENEAKLYVIVFILVIMLIGSQLMTIVQNETSTLEYHQSKIEKIEI